MGVGKWFNPPVLGTGDRRFESGHPYHRLINSVVEYFPYKEGVNSSNLLSSTNYGGYSSMVER